MKHFIYPPRLPRPAPRVPRREAVDAAEPSLAHVPMEYILHSLAVQGPQ
jgi:hypothetical protein